MIVARGSLPWPYPRPNPYPYPYPYPYPLTVTTAVAVAVNRNRNRNSSQPQRNGAPAGRAGHAIVQVWPPGAAKRCAQWRCRALHG